MEFSSNRFISIKRSWKTFITVYLKLTQGIVTEPELAFKLYLFRDQQCLHIEQAILFIAAIQFAISLSYYLYEELVVARGFARVKMDNYFYYPLFSCLGMEFQNILWLYLFIYNRNANYHILWISFHKWRILIETFINLFKLNLSTINNNNK